MLNLERWARLRLKGCFIHKKFGLPRMLMCSYPKTSLWYQSKGRSWRVTSSGRVFLKIMRKILATKPVSGLRLRCLYPWGPREPLWFLCLNSDTWPPKSNYKWMTLWISVGLLSFWMVILKRVTTAGRGHCPCCVQTNVDSFPGDHQFWDWWAQYQWSRWLGSWHSGEDPGESQDLTWQEQGACSQSKTKRH